MSIVVGQNSWVTLAEADTYFTDRIGTSSWFSLTDTPSTPGADSKEGYLITAFNILIGSPDVSLSPSLTDDNVKKAQMEFALFLVQHYTEFDERSAAQSTGVSEFQYSKRKEKFDNPGDGVKLPYTVIGLLSLYSTANVIVNLKGQYDE